MKEKKELMNLTKEELMLKYRSLLGIYAKTLSRVNTKEALIRSMHRRFKKIRDSMDYLLGHPWSLDSSTYTKLHSRDKTARLSHYYQNKKTRGTK